jgi:integrase
MHKHRKPIPGIEVRHRNACRTHDGGGCNCSPSYRAKISGPNGRNVSPWFPALGAATNWLADTRAQINRGTWFEPTRVTLSDAAEEFIVGARAGTVLSRKGRPYAPSVVRGYESGLRLHVLPRLGPMRLSEIRRSDVQRLVDVLHAGGFAASAVRNNLDPLRRIFDRAVKRDLIPFSPCAHLEVPRGTGTRDRVASLAEAAVLLHALAESDRALWAAAFYAGLRMSELRALRWSDADLDDGGGVLRIVQTWDDVERERDGGKSAAAVRTVMVIDELRPFLRAHKLATGRRGDDLMFGSTATKAMVRSTVRSRALRAWTIADLRPITPHECRHTFASVMAAAGVDDGERQRQMGHKSSDMMDRYTHGLDGSVADAATKVQRYVDQQRARQAG